MINKKQIEALALERINEINQDLFIVSLTISPANKIRIELDKTEGYVNIDECVSVSRNVEHNLDREQEDFEIEVSSAGLDQPFRVLQQYQKNIGKEVKVLLKETNKSLEGELLKVNTEGIVVRSTEKEKVEGKKKKELVTHDKELKFEEIKETKIVISFKK